MNRKSRELKSIHLEDWLAASKNTARQYWERYNFSVKAYFFCKKEGGGHDFYNMETLELEEIVREAAHKL